MKQWDNESREKFNASVERFREAMQDCEHKSRVIEVDFQRRQVVKVVSQGRKIDKNKKAA